jgi:hypothetical protein
MITILATNKKTLNRKNPGLTNLGAGSNPRQGEKKKLPSFLILFTPPPFIDQKERRDF